MYKKSLLTTLLFMAVFILVACDNEKIEDKLPTEFMNPVFEPVLADPAIIRGDDGYFYAYGTEDYGNWAGDDRVGIPIVRSTNLVDWTYVGDVFSSYNKPTWGKFNAGVWAPDIIKIGNKYNYYYSLSIWDDENPGIGLATADHPAGPFTDHGMILNTETSGVYNSIDSYTFVFEDRVWMVWGSFFGLYMVELNSDGTEVLNMDDKVWLGGLSQGRSAFEAPYIIEKNGSYFMFVSLGHCCLGLNSTYYVNVFKADSPLGPWYDKEGKSMLNQDSLGEPVIKGNEYVAGPGHNSVIIDDNGDYWIVYHAYDRQHTLGSYGSSPRRSLFIDKLIWDEEGFPLVENLEPTLHKTDLPKIDWNAYLN